MAAEVKLPLVGSVSRRGLLIGGGLAAALVALVWWRNRASGGAELAVDPDALEDPSAEDLSGLGSGGGGGASVGAGGTTITAAPAPVTTNAEWFAVAREALMGAVDD